MIEILVPRISSDRITPIPNLTVKELNSVLSWKFVAVGERSWLEQVSTGYSQPVAHKVCNLGALASLAQVSINLCTIYNHNRRSVPY